MVQLINVPPPGFIHITSIYTTVNGGVIIHSLDILDRAHLLVGTGILIHIEENLILLLDLFQLIEYIFSDLWN